MSRDIVDNPRSALPLIIAGRIQDEPADRSAVLVQDPDIPAGHQQSHPLTGLAPTHPDVVQAALASEGDRSGIVDLVMADPIAVCLDASAARSGLRARLEGV
jgi:hypothetical protein